MTLLQRELKERYVIINNTPTKVSSIYIGNGDSTATKIRPTKREPGTNTIAYYPLTDDNKDYVSGNSPTDTRGTITFSGTYCQVSNGAMYWNLGNTINLAQPFTIFQRLKPTSRRSYSSRLGYPTINSSTTGGFEIWQTGTSTNSSTARFGLTEGSGAWNINNGRDMPMNERHCFVLVYTGTQLFVYRDGEVIDYSPIIGVTSGGGFNPSGTATFMRFSVNNNYDYYDGYVAHLGVENRAWSQDDAIRFYNSFVETLS